MSSAENAFLLLVETFNRLGIAFMVCGSLASSMHGIMRATRDIDVVADLQLSQVEPLVRSLGSQFYADPKMIRDRLERGRAFNLIHYGSGMKLDVFPLSRDAFQQAQFARRRWVRTAQFGGEIDLPIASAEDTILAKLQWYRLGGEVSERQWNDVRGVVEVQKDRLELGYLRRWAAHLEVSDLLARLLAECGSAGA